MIIKFKPITTLIILNLLLLINPIYAAEVSGKVIAFSCYGCHGSDGTLVQSSLPSLNTLSADNIEQSLLAFKYDKKYSSIMNRIAKGYTDSELKAVSLYYSQH